MRRTSLFVVGLASKQGDRSKAEFDRPFRWIWRDVRCDGSGEWKRGDVCLTQVVRCVRLPPAFPHLTASTASSIHAVGSCPSLSRHDSVIPSLSTFPPGC